MKTNLNFFSKLSKSTLVISMAFAILIPISCQNAANQSFNFKNDFIKQMVYQVSNEFMTRAGLSVQAKNNLNETSAILVNYKVAGKSINQPSYNDTELACFLTAAASLNTPIAEEAVVEKDNTLEFLTAAAQLYTEVARDSKDETLDLLINAAQFNTAVTSEESSQDELLDFLTKAANLNTSVVE